jgi:flagellin-like protein
MSGDRGASSVIGTTLLVALVIVVATVVSMYTLGMRSTVSSEAPQISVSHALVDDGSEQTVAITMESGESLRIDRLYVTGSKQIDIGGPPSAGSEAADQQYASSREKFDESSDGTPQVDVGETWDSGETVYVDPVGSVSGVTLEIYWNTEPVEGVNPGTVRGDTSYRLAEIEL